MSIVERYSASSDCPECDFEFNVSMIGSEDEAKAMLRVISELHGEMAHGNRGTITFSVEETTFPLSRWAERPPRLN